MTDQSNALVPQQVVPRQALQALPPLPKKTIIVTGGSGFIGGAFVIDLANQFSQNPDPYRYACSILT